jgi:hypothetical protein
MKLLPAMVLEVIASMYKHHPLGAAAPTSTNQVGKAKPQGDGAVATKVRPPRQRLQGGNDKNIANVAHELGISPGVP